MAAEQLTYIIDDDRDVRASIAFMLGAAGRTCRSFSGGREFLQAVPKLVPGCVLLDIRMPGMGGLEVLDALVQRGIDWPVVVMTGHGEGEIAAQAIVGGALEFLEKPFVEDVLLRCLDRSGELLET